MKRCVIIGGAAIENYDKIKSYLKEDDYFIFCDSGLFHMDRLNISADLIVGDFDSHENPRLSTETIILPREKDDTDTFFAAKEAVKRGFKNFLLIGTIGGRFDHSIGNISILYYLDSLGLNASIIDDYSEIEIVSNRPAYIDEGFSFFSLLNLSGKADGISITNAKYPLDNASIHYNYQYGISNEVLNGKTACVSIKEGMLLLVKVF